MSDTRFLLCNRFTSLGYPNVPFVPPMSPPCPPQEPVQLTEADVRRIVAEEIEHAFRRRDIMAEYGRIVGRRCPHV